MACRSTADCLTSLTPLARRSNAHRPFTGLHSLAEVVSGFLWQRMVLTKAPGFAEQLDRLAVERSALEQLLTAARSLGSLHKGLESSLQLGKSTAALPAEAQRLYLSLDNKIQAMSDDEVLKRLHQLERKITLQLKNLAPLIDPLVSSSPAQSDEQAAALAPQQLDVFQRQAKTAITLRALLHKRGLSVPVLTMPIAASVVERKLAVIELQEQRCRVQVTEAVDTMATDINVLMTHSECSDAMCETLGQVFDDLVSAQEHLSAGLSLDSLPISIDIIDGQVVADEPPVPGLPPAEDIAAGAMTAQGESTALSESAALSEPTALDESAPLSEEPASKAAEVLAAPAAKDLPAKSLWQKLILWLNTPWGTRWRDIDDK
jgi:hypothetical protein